MIQPTQESEEKTKVAEILDNRKKKNNSNVLDTYDVTKMESIYRRHTHFHIVFACFNNCTHD